MTYENWFEQEIKLRKIREILKPAIGAYKEAKEEADDEYVAVYMADVINQLLKTDALYRVVEVLGE